MGGGIGRPVREDKVAVLVRLFVCYKINNTAFLQF